MQANLSTYLSIFKWIPSPLKTSIAFAFFFSTVASLFEVLSISSIVPILLDLTSDTNVKEVTFISDILSMFGTDKIYLVAVLLFACSIGFRIFNFSYQVRTSHKIGVSIGGILIKQTLAKPFSILSRQKTSALITDMVNRVDAVVAHLIFPILNILSSLIITITISFFVILTVGSVIFIVVICYFLIFYLLVYALVKRRLRKNSIILNTQNEQLVALMEEIFNARREIILSNVEKNYSDSYLYSAIALREAMASVSILSQVPRFLTEFIAFSMLILLLFFRDLFGISVTQVALLLFTLQKLVPYVHGIYTSYSSLTAGYDLIYSLSKSLGSYTSFDKQNIPQYRVSKGGGLRLVDIHYSYPDTDHMVLKGVNLEVHPGEIICINGRSGSGKTTLLNIIAGLEFQTSGQLIYSNKIINKNYLRSFQKKVFYLGQTPYIKNTSLQENISFPSSGTITNEELTSLLKKVDLNEDALWPKEMGEGGNQVSGGQAQRIALLRALFKDVDLLLLDEPTSALDSKTAETVMRSIFLAKKTVIMISHNTPNLDYFDKIFQMEKGELLRVK